MNFYGKAPATRSRAFVWSEGSAQAKNWFYLLPGSMLPRRLLPLRGSYGRFIHRPNNLWSAAKYLTKLAKPCGWDRAPPGKQSVSQAECESHVGPHRPRLVFLPCTEGLWPVCLSGSARTRSPLRRREPGFAGCRGGCQKTVTSR